jgi:flavin-dependent dehydrogenase
MMVPVVVAGGGLSGAAVAAMLAAAGRQVVVVEREALPVDKICGEFVSAEAIGYLDRIGLDVQALGGHTITRFRLVLGHRMVQCDLPFTGLGLSRRVLDEALLRHCAGCGAEVRRGRRLQFLPAREGFQLREEGGETFSAGTVFLATGKHDVNCLRRKVATVPDLIGLKCHFRLSPAQQAILSGHVEIILLQDGYAGLQLVEDGIANLCLLVGRDRFMREGGTLETLLDGLRRGEPHMAERLAGSVSLFARPLSIARVPYGFMHRPEGNDPRNLFRLGDQMGVIPSFTGDGMSIALHSAALAAACFLAGCSAEDYHRRMRTDVARQIGFANFLYGVSTSLPVRRALMHFAGFLPDALRLVASLTRISPRALARARPYVDAG